MNKYLLTILPLTFLIGIVFTPHAVGETTPPNIVFMFADDLGYGDLACYGHPYARTPVLDRLASEGTRFTQFYVSGVTCCPSRTGFMTGLHTARFPKYPASHGFGDRVTVTELLQKHGYRTGHFGKWHIGIETDGVYGIDQYATGDGDKTDPRGRDAGIYDAAIRFIKTNADRPFYINIWGHITHYAVNAPDNMVEKFSDVQVDRTDFSDTMQKKFDECEQIGGELDSSMREYLGEVYSLDANVGRVLQTLDELGLRENTIVVFSSDHGPAPVLLGAKKESKEFSANMLGYAGQLRGGKHEQYEGGVRVPFIIRWPGHVEAGRVDTKSVTSGLDWLPTLCAITGIEDFPGELDGEDVSQAWFGADRIRTSPLFWRVSSPGGSPSMRLGKWKFHDGNKRGKQPQLYDLMADPSESKNVAQQHPAVVKRLKTEVDAWVSDLPTEYKKLSKDDIRKSKQQRKP